MSKVKTTAYQDGRTDSPIIVLGQAPGRSEIRLGRPLIGPSGEVFAECLNAAGLTRRDVYILNIWETDVWTDKKGAIWLDKDEDTLLWKSGSGFTERGLELAANTLERIRAAGGNTILALGQQALELCTGISKAVLKWRGSPLTGMDRVGQKFVVATIHPAATIHGVYLWRYLIISDMKKAARQSRTDKSLVPDLNIIIRPSLKDVLDYIEHCRSVGVLATDLEVINHQVSCFCLTPNRSESLVCSFMDEQGEMWTEEEETQIWEAYASLMYDEDVMKINQNLVGFDAQFLMMQNRIIVRGPIGDGMIAQHILYPEFNKGLDFIASVHTDHPYWKDEGKMWKNVGGSTADAYVTFWRYNGKDGCVAFESWEVLAQELTQRGMWPTYAATVEMLPALLFATMDGLAIDEVGLAATNLKIEAEIKAGEEELEAVAEWPFNPNSPAQCKKYFYETKKLNPYRNAAGGVTTDDKAMSRIFRKTGLREAKLVQELRGLKKLKGTYLEVEFDSDKRLRCSWNPRGTWTGRLSSSKTIFGRGMNLQNLDPKFKDFIVEDVD